MGKQIRKGRTVSTRNGYSILESMTTRSAVNLGIAARIADEKAAKNAAAIRRVHH